MTVQIRNLTVRRGKRVILEGLSCEMEAGTITGLLGPSGAGKTTLIRAIVGVQRIASGTITVLGQPAGSAGLRSRTGYMTQSPAVYADLTVQENVAYFAAIAGASPARVAAAIDDVGLTAAAHQVTATLSGGQRSRVSLACSAIGNPDLLVLDEPTVGQDPLLREEIWDSLRRRAAAGATVLVSSHVMDEAGRCDRLLLLRDGALLTAGTPASIMADSGESTMDAAFLTLIRRQGVAA